ncbi:MAG: hydrogenase 2 operon protein HybA [Thermoanaerobaculia bacterium]
MDRRSALKVLAGAGAASVAGALPARASAPAEAPPDAVGLLYDATLCIGCKTCVVACHEANGLPPDDRAHPLYDMPMDLNDRTKTVIKLFRSDDGRTSYFKAQCMHCIDPGCVSACMLGAFQKREHGIVTWEPDLCVGCRYCQVACPYNVPKFEWDTPVPKIVKCELCNHLLAEGKEPACTEVCPVGAVIYGERADLLAEAKRRIAESPGRYQETIFGETEGGGTQCLVLAPSNVTYQEMGLPDLGDEPTPGLARTVQHTIYKGFVAPVALYGLLSLVMWRNRRRSEEGAEEEVPS